MTPRRSKERQLVEKFESRILANLTAYGPQAWDDLIVELDPGKTVYAKKGPRFAKHSDRVRLDEEGNVSLP